MTKRVPIEVLVEVEHYDTGDYLWCDVGCCLFDFKRRIGRPDDPFCRLSEKVLKEDDMGILRCGECLRAGVK